MGESVATCSCSSSCRLCTRPFCSFTAATTPWACRLTRSRWATSSANYGRRGEKRRGRVVGGEIWEERCVVGGERRDMGREMCGGRRDMGIKRDVYQAHAWNGNLSDGVIMRWNEMMPDYLPGRCEYPAPPGRGVARAGAASAPARCVPLPPAEIEREPRAAAV